MAQLRQNPLDFGVLDALRQHCEATQSYAVWAEALEQHARAASDAEGDPIELGRLHYELGNLYREHLGRSDRALDHYRTAIDFDAAQRPALAAARTILSESGEWEQVIDLVAREAESLPPGRKRAAKLYELASLYKAQLERRRDAIHALREAVGYTPDDLQLQHELATLLLESADHPSDARDAGDAGEMRRDAADVLVLMARAVSDDYAFAYTEAALDAVPDHAAALSLLEDLAPRLGRSDTLAPRWLAAMHGTRDRRLARGLRLKMARAYTAVGQFDDARICLEPLLEQRDPEALELARELAGDENDDETEAEAAERDERAHGDEGEHEDDENEHEHEHEYEHDEGFAGSRELDARTFARDDTFSFEPAGGAEAAEEELTSSELLLESEQGSSLSELASLREMQRQRELERALEGEHDAPGEDDLVDELSDLSSVMVAEEGEHEQDEHSQGEAEGGRGDVHDALRALAALDRVEDERLDTDHGWRALLEGPDLAAELPASSEQPVALNKPDEAQFASHEELLDLTELAAESSERALGLEPSVAAAATPNDGRDNVAPAGEAKTLRPPEPRRASKPPSPAVIEFYPPREDEADPFAEETQPRATPLTLAELTALTGTEERQLMATPEDDSVRHDPDGEVTQITPAEDPQLTELRTLREELAKRLRFRDRRGAAEVAEMLLDRGMFDAEAIEALEEHYRLSRDFRRLRDLSMRIAREPAFSDEVRNTRLREAVMLSENKLGDQDGAAAALRELLALEPQDAEAFDKLKRLLRRAQRWDELAGLFEQRAGELDDPRARAELLRELGAIHREKRGAPDAAIAAYSRARELHPGEADDELALSELYLATGRYAEAAGMLEARLVRAEPQQRAALLASLARLYEEQLQDDESAQQALETWRTLEPRRPEPLHALIRIFERRGDYRALVQALVDQLELATASDRVRIHVRIAEIALIKLDDAGRAADSYAEAIASAPHEQALWRAAAPAFERAGRANELDELLWGLAQGRRDRAVQASLFEYLAEARAARDDLPGAILAREAQYGVTQSPSVLSALIDLLRSADRPADLARRLDELARRSEPALARTLRLERAGVLAEKLRDPEAAKAELERVLSEFGPDDAQALRLLVDFSIATGDTARRASAQERLIKLAPSLSARVELAIELVDLYERVLYDGAGAIRVLSLWTTLEPSNPQPYLRLAPLLAQAGRKRELIETLDKLAALAITDDEAGEFVLRAARVAIEIEDYDGAWRRLVPRIVERQDGAAEVLLRELATTAGRGEQLAALYVGLAQRAGDPAQEKQRWADAARIFERQVGAHDRALEAMLRALAKELDNRELLGEVERLAEHARAWPRLAQVYDRIVRKADGTETRIQLLMRHARIVEARAGDTRTAFERVWLAFQLDPTLDESYGEAKRLAIATGRREELLNAHERRAQSGASREARLEALLEACALAEHEFEDRARAVGYLSRAVALAGDSAPLLNDVEARAQALDAGGPLVPGRGLTAELADVYVRLAGEAERTPVLASLWYSRAARIHELVLDEPEAAFRALERASALAPNDETLLDELYRVAALANHWEALARHLQHTAEAAIDSNSSSAALSRLGALCERELASPSRAADAYEQLVRLRPKDADASRRLRACLHAAERYDELLIAIDRELFVLKPEQGRRELLKQAAETWEFGLKNRYEALDAWKKVAALAPADPDAVAALTRLRSRPRMDESLLDEAVVVLPEDLRPTVAATAAMAGAAATTATAAATAGAAIAANTAAAPSATSSSLFASVGDEDVEPSSSFLADPPPSAESAGTDAPDAAPAAEPSPDAEPDDAAWQALRVDAWGNLSGTHGAAQQPLSDTGDRTMIDDALDALEAGRDEGPAEARDFDADVTLPLDRGGPEREPLVTLEGLSALIEHERQTEREHPAEHAQDEHEEEQEEELELEDAELEDALHEDADEAGRVERTPAPRPRPADEPEDG